MVSTSEVTGLKYNTDDTVKIFNSVQIGKYIKNGAIIVDVGVDDDKFYVRFNKKECQVLFDKWCRREL